MEVVSIEHERIEERSRARGNLLVLASAVSTKPGKGWLLAVVRPTECTCGQPNEALTIWPTTAVESQRKTLQGDEVMRSMETQRMSMFGWGLVAVDVEVRRARRSSSLC